MGEYSLEQFAKAYLWERQRDAAGMRLAQVAAATRPGAAVAGWNQFAALLRWWLRFTSLLLRYPANPARISAKLAAIGFPALISTAARGTGGPDRVG